MLANQLPKLPSRSSAAREHAQAAEHQVGSSLSADYDERRELLHHCADRQVRAELSYRAVGTDPE